MSIWEKYFEMGQVKQGRFRDLYNADVDIFGVESVHAGSLNLLGLWRLKTVPNVKLRDTSNI